MPTFVTLTSAEVDDIPHQLVLFTAVAATVYLVGALLSRETRGHIAPADERTTAPPLGAQA
jgi:hypothetical protein